MNKEEIRVVVDKVISIIKAMGDGESSSINEIINDNNMETKDKIIVKNYVTEELKRDDICLDYGSSNEGLDDKFKKSSISKLIIDLRFHNEKISKGNIVNNTTKFVLSGTKGSISSIIKFVSSDEDGGYYGATSAALTFKMNDRLNEFKEIINTIKNGNYKHNEDNYTAGVFDKRYLNYADIIIDNEEYEILLTDNLLGRLMGVIKMNEVSNTAYAAYMDLNKK